MYVGYKQTNKQTNKQNKQTNKQNLVCLFVLFVCICIYCLSPDACR